MKKVIHESRRGIQLDIHSFMFQLHLHVIIELHL
jgi:hypothetical protein